MHQILYPSFNHVDRISFYLIIIIIHVKKEFKCIFDDLRQALVIKTKNVSNLEINEYTCQALVIGKQFCLLKIVSWSQSYIISFLAVKR
jgi:hypothetical protein